MAPTAQRTAQALETFVHEGWERTNSKLAPFLDVTDISCSNLLCTPREVDHLPRVLKLRFCGPATRFRDASQRFVATAPLQARVKEPLEFLSSQTGGTSMCNLDGTRVNIIVCQESLRALRYTLQAGTVVKANPQGCVR